MTTSSLVGQRRSYKAPLKARLPPEKGHGHCLVVSYQFNPLHYSFLNPGETITSERYAQQIDEMQWKLQHLQLALASRKGPTLLHDNVQPHIAQPMLQKFDELAYEVLSHLPHWPNFSPTNHHFMHLGNSWQGKCSHNQQDTKSAFQEFVESQSMDFSATGINKLISHWQKYVDCNGFYFD